MIAFQGMITFPVKRYDMPFDVSYSIITSEYGIVNKITMFGI